MNEVAWYTLDIKLMLRRKLERYFEFESLRTSWRTEVLAGATTFVSMAYIIFVNPAILADAGMPFASVLLATCIAAGIGSILMGALARYPIAMAPGMGLNAYFTYSVVKGLGVPWQTALGAVFLSGIAFLFLNLIGVRRMIVAAIPADLYAAVACGIGFFIALVGFRQSGLIVSSPATMVTLGNVRDPQTMLSVAGLLTMATLLVWGVRGAMLIGVLAITGITGLAGLVPSRPLEYSLSALGATALQLDVRSALRLGALEIVFVFLFVDLFDNVGTLLAVGKRAGLFNSASEIPRLNRILYTDALATLSGSLVGTSTIVSYIESTAGVTAGGRTGVTAIVTGILFLLSMAVAPLIGAIPAAATAPALILIGSFMMAHVAEIEWSRPVVAIPAFLTITAIPLSYSIANGLAFGFVAYALLRVITGEWRSLHWFTYILTALFLARFWYMGAG